MKVSSYANNARKTIVFKLIVAVVAIFLTMICILYISINYYQTRMMEDIADRLEVDLNELENTNQTSFIVLTSDEIPSQTDFLFYTAMISFVVICIGTIVFYIVIKKVMTPLNQLADKVSDIDMERANYEKNEVLIENGGLEIQELSRVLDRAFSEIYEGYERQRSFSINVAHEVRTPLAILLTKIDVFKKKGIQNQDEIVEFVDSMQKNITRLSEMVDGIMLLSKNQELQKQNVCIGEIIYEVLFDLEDMAAKNEIVLQFGGTDAILNTDEQIMERVLFNLVENGIKYNEPGGKVEISVKDMNEYLLIRISDTGIGIADDEKNHIFDLFYRVDKSRSSKTGGYGIGLSLVMHIVNRLNGTVSIKDNHPKGTIFEVMLPKN